MKTWKRTPNGYAALDADGCVIRDGFGSATEAALHSNLCSIQREVITDPLAIHEAFAADQRAEDEREMRA